MKFMLGFLAGVIATQALVWAIMGVSGRIAQWEEDNLGIRRS